VIKPDFRGHGNSQGLAEGGHFSPAYTYDTLNLIASLKQYPVVNAGRLGLIGHSMGAHVALRTAVVSPDVKASVYVSGVVGSFYDLVFNWPRPPYVNDQPIASTRSRLDQLKQEHGDPKTNPDFWNQASAINYVKNVAGPVQIDHGGADSSVPQLFSDHLNQALVDAHKPVEYFNYPGSDHQFSNSADRTLLLQRMRQLFDIALR
jgi:dipeptidyl aminopeptidase/acylaminoacyl peptidase